MDFSLPTSSALDLASTTNGYIISFKSPVVIVIGVLLAFFLLEVIISALVPNQKNEE